MISRKFADAGIKPWLAWVLLAICFTVFSFLLFQRTGFAPYIYLAISLAISGKLSNKQRTEFLEMCFGERKLYPIRLAENIAITLPFLIFLFYKLMFLHAIILLVLCLGMALFNFRSTTGFTMWTPFSKKPFEFTTGFRSTFYLLLVAYALVPASVVMYNFNMGIAAVLLVFIISMSYYSNPEDEYYVWIFNQDPRQFLFGKIKTALIFSTLLALPVILVIAFVFSGNIMLLLLFILTGWAFLVCMILGKYAAFPEELNITQGILIGLCLLFPPVLIVLIPYFFRKSENRLSSLLK